MRRAVPEWARRSTAAFILAVAAASPLAAQDVAPFSDTDELPWWEEAPTLPETLRGTVRPQENPSSVRRIDTIQEVFQALRACWRAPAGSGLSGQEITVRLSFKRNGEVLGKPRITYYKQGTREDLREPFTRAVREAFERCTPLPFTESFGAAIAGRVFAIRFVDARPM